MSDDQQPETTPAQAAYRLARAELASANSRAHSESHDKPAEESK